MRPRVPVTGRASKHVTYPSSLFFSFPPSSPLELSASLDLLAHRPNSRLLFPCWHLCAVVSFTAHHPSNIRGHTSPSHPSTAKQPSKPACLHHRPAHTPTWLPPTAIDHRPRLPVSSQQLPWEQPSQTLTTYRRAQSQQLPLPRMAHIPPGHPLAATRPAPPPAATPQPASSLPPETQPSTWPLQRMCGTRQGTLAWLAGPSLGREVT